MRWAEGPVWFGDGRYVLVSDIPNNRIMRYDEATGGWGVFRQPSNFANGNARDRQGRLISCEHLTRRVTRTEYDGKITVLADSFNGKRLNSPNDIVCKSDGSIWFTDPPFGISGEWEGDKATPELPHSVYRIAPDGKLGLVTAELAGPNGLAFSPDEKKLYIIELRAQPNRLIWAFDVGADGSHAVQQDKTDRRQRARSARRIQGRYRRQSLVRLGQQRLALRQARGTRRRQGLQSRKARPSASSAFPSAAPIWRSAAPRRTACSWRAAIRSTLCMSKREGRCKSVIMPLAALWRAAKIGLIGQILEPETAARAN